MASCATDCCGSDVGDDEVGLAARCPDGGDDFFAALAITAGHDDMGALRRERFGDGAADAGGGTGDEGPANCGGHVFELPIEGARTIAAHVFDDNGVDGTTEDDSRSLMHPGPWTT